MGGHPVGFIRAAEASVADLAVIPMWDLLCCGSEGRMNHPSTLGKNWKWRMLPGEFREDIIGRLRWLTDTFQRMLVPPENRRRAGRKTKMKQMLQYLKAYKKSRLLHRCLKCWKPVLNCWFRLLWQTSSMSVSRMATSRISGECALMIALRAGTGVFPTAQYFAAKAAMGFGTALRKALFGHINSLSYNELDQIGTPTLITRMTSDINQAQTGVNMMLRLFLRSPFIVIGAVVMALLSAQN